MEKKITLNGQTYILESEINKSIHVQCENRFNTKEEAEIHKSLKKAGYGFNEEVDCITETEALERPYIAVSDKAQVSVIKANSIRARLVLRRYINSQQSIKEPTLKYDDLPDNILIESYFNAKCLESIMHFFKTVCQFTDSSRVNVQMKPDYPITIYNDDFIFILAPLDKLN